MRRFTAFKDSLACRYGLREAIFLRKLFLWVRRGKVDGSCYERNGILWVRMTLAQMQGEIPYFLRHDTEDLLRKVQSYGLHFINSLLLQNGRQCLIIFLELR